MVYAYPEADLEGALAPYPPPPPPPLKFAKHMLYNVTYLILEKKKIFLCKGTVVIKVESINMVN